MISPRRVWFPWARNATPPIRDARLRAAPEDFVVEERLPFALTGDGEHVWLRIQKRGINTDQVAKLLARIAGVPRRNVGFAGMKDRHAVTVQWFSVHRPGRSDEPEWRAALPPEVTVLDVVRHARKLKTGALEGNRFTITLRDCGADREALSRRIEGLSAQGVPNYFGEQRFGHDGANLERARAMLNGTFEVRDRHLRGIYLSAARSFLFNEVLAQRIGDGSWQTGIAGEAFVLDGTRSFFVVDEVDAEIQERLARHDIHPSGPLWGGGDPPSRGPARECELAVVARHAALAEGLAAAGLEQERRPLRLMPRDLEAEWLDATTLRLAFSLPGGTYATAVLRELAEYEDVSGPSE